MNWKGQGPEYGAWCVWLSQFEQSHLETEKKLISDLIKTWVLLTSTPSKPLFPSNLLPTQMRGS